MKLNEIGFAFLLACSVGACSDDDDGGGGGTDGGGGSVDAAFDPSTINSCDLACQYLVTCAGDDPVQCASGCGQLAAADAEMVFACLRTATCDVAGAGACIPTGN